MDAGQCAPGLVRCDPHGDDLVLGAVAAVDAECSVEEYLGVRAGGATHDEAIDACVAKIPSRQYCTARADGLSHAQVCEFWQHDHDLSIACKALAAGASWLEIVKVLNTTMSLVCYVGLRRVGDSHRCGQWCLLGSPGRRSNLPSGNTRGQSRAPAHPASQTQQSLLVE